MKKFETYIGIDVSKNTLDVTVINDEEPNKTHYERFGNNLKELKQLIGFVRLHAKAKSNRWLFCMEHTGIYTMHLSVYFSLHKYSYALVPAIDIQRSVGLRRGKSDKTDSRAIAKYAYLRQHDIILSSLPEKVLIKLKLLLSYRDRLTRAKKMLKTISVEMDQFLGKELTKDVIQSSSKMSLKIDAEQKMIDNKIMALVKENKELCDQFDLITTIPGIGPQTALNLMVYTRCFSTFDNARQLACYAGVAPFEYTSGTSIRGKTKVSPMANKKLKVLLSMCALNAKKADPEIGIYYLRKVEEGKNPMSVINAIKNKLILRVFATVKRGTPYVKTMNYAA